jgi:hypothetical protein
MPAGPSEPRNTDAVAYRESICTSADLDYTSDDFMSRHYRPVKRR